jgi:hypothetical protein
MGKTLSDKNENKVYDFAKIVYFLFLKINYLFYFHFYQGILFTLLRLI